MNKDANIITIPKFLNRAMKNWKLIFIITILVSTIGIIIGYLYSSRPIRDAKYGATVLNSIKFEDGEQYKTKIVAIDEAIAESKTYVQTLSSLTYNGQPDVEKYQEDIQKIENQINNLEKNEYLKIKLYFYENNGHDKIVMDLINYGKVEEYSKIKVNLNEEFFVENIDKTKDELKFYIKDLKNNILSSETSLQFISSIKGNIPQDNMSIKIYNRELDNASALSRYKLLLKNNEDRLHKLEQYTEKDVTIIKNNMDDYIEVTVERLNGIIDKINLLADKISKDKYVVITAGINIDKKKPNQFAVKIVHGHKQDSFESRFVAITTLSLLLGLVLGLFFAGVKKENG